MNIERVPPQDLQTERAVLASMLLDSECLDTGIHMLRQGSFYATANGLVFVAMVSLVAASAPVDMLSVAGQLRKIGSLDAAGGEEYLAEIAEYMLSPSSFEHHCKQLIDMATMRELIVACTHARDAAYAGTVSAAETIDAVESAVMSLRDSGGRQECSSVRDLLPPMFDAIERIQKGGGSPGVATGFYALDHMTTGLHPGDLVIVAARPGMGKTSFALSVAMHCAMRTAPALPVAVFSLEMAKEQIVQRISSTAAEVSMSRLRAGTVTKRELAALGIAANEMFDAPIYVDDTAGINVLELRSKARRIKHKHGLGLVVVDYLQLMSSVGKHGSREQEISTISRSLKSLAKELGVPVVALSQLSRAVEQRGGDKRPQLSDLRESGAIEQDADVVLFLYRDYKYNSEADRCSAELIIGKQRNGPVGVIPLHFQEEYTKFSNVDTRREAEVGARMTEVSHGW